MCGGEGVESFLFVLEGGPPSVDWAHVKGSQRVLAFIWSILSGRTKILISHSPVNVDIIQQK